MSIDANKLKMELLRNGIEITFEQSVLLFDLFRVFAIIQINQFKENRVLQYQF
jgi:hypothetical protein